MKKLKLATACLMFSVLSLSAISVSAEEGSTQTTEDTTILESTDESTDESIENIEEGTEAQEALTELLKEIKKLKASDFTAHSWNALEEDVNAAEKALNDQNEQASKDILAAIKTNQRALVSVKELADIVENSKEIKKDLYTEATWSVFESTQKEAMEMLEAAKDKNNAFTQQEIVDMEQYLTAAERQLSKVQKPSTPESSDSTADSSDTVDSSEGTLESKEEQSDSENGNTQATDDSSSVPNAESYGQTGSSTNDKNSSSSKKPNSKQEFPVQSSTSKTPYPVTNKPKEQYPAEPKRPLPQTGEVIRSYGWIGILVIAGVGGAVYFKYRSKK